LIKGPLFNSRPAGVYKRKIAELMAQLEENNQTIFCRTCTLQRLRMISCRSLRPSRNSAAATNLIQPNAARALKHESD
jgi:hypothetical protein